MRIPGAHGSEFSSASPADGNMRRELSVFRILLGLLLMITLVGFLIACSEPKSRYCQAGKTENRPGLTACFRTGECEEAIKAQSRRAEAGNGAENLLLGDIYMRAGEVQKAGERIRAAAESGCIEGMILYAQLLRDGKGVDKNYEQAAHWFREAAKAGAGTAASLLSNLYRNGEGVARDNAEALDWSLVGECLKSRGVKNTGASDYELCLQTIEK